MVLEVFLSYLHLVYGGGGVTRCGCVVWACGCVDETRIGATTRCVLGVRNVPYGYTDSGQKVENPRGEKLFYAIILE